MTELKPGLTGERTEVVTAQLTAKAMGSGLAEVLATPYLIALMEGAACNALEDAYQPGQSSVGTMVHVFHKAPTPVGMSVTAKALLEEVDGRRLVFTIEAWDEKELVGDGKHERFIINQSSFQEKADSKSQKA
jgi:predicted thioesterase